MNGAVDVKASPRNLLYYQASYTTVPWRIRKQAVTEERKLLKSG
jgi:hypothetical protein